MFKKNQRVEMTVAGLESIRVLRDGTIRKHRHGVEMASTGVVVTASRKGERVTVRLDSMPETSQGESYPVEYWQSVVADHICYDCEQREGTEQRTLIRGPRQGQRVSLCSECLVDLQTRLLVE